jgi:signal transduction histidine kinase
MTLEDLVDGGVSADTIRDVRRIGTAGSHLLHLINTILDLSKIETGEEEITVEEISVKELLDEVIKLSWPLTEKSENRLEIKISDRIQHNFMSDRKKLCQVMVNLVGNATKFTENGTITLSVDLVNNLESIEFLVEDTGIGIPEDQADSIFEPFRQLDNSYNRKYSGSGLGLAISKAYCSLIGGDINYQRGEFGGARFNVTIPYSKT